MGDGWLAKGKAWPVEDERRLKDWFTSGTTDIRVLAFSFDGQYSEVAIRLKLARLGLLKEDDDELEDSTRSSSSTFELPMSCRSLMSIISGTKIFKGFFADYINYRGIEGGSSFEFSEEINVVRLPDLNPGRQRGRLMS